MAVTSHFQAIKDERQQSKCGYSQTEALMSALPS